MVVLVVGGRVPKLLVVEVVVGSGRHSKLSVDGRDSKLLVVVVEVVVEVYGGGIGCGDVGCMTDVQSSR